MNHEAQIANLLYIYAERMDAGDLDGTAALFTHAHIMTGGQDELVDHHELRKTWEKFVKIYPCGTPRTKHVVTNPIIEVSEDGETASSRSYYTVLQATDGLPLQAIAAGRYHDRFARIDGKWQFTFRNYQMLDLIGDVSAHLLVAVPS